MMNEFQCEPEHFKGRIIFMSMYIDIVWQDGTELSGRPDGFLDKTAEQMMMNFSESGHPIFRVSSASERG